MYLKILGGLTTLLIPAVLSAQLITTPGSVLLEAFQVNYASNLDMGDSVINITNAGTSWGVQTTTGNICANIYVFSPDEQLQACCSCKVSPNGLQAVAVIGPAPRYPRSLPGFPGLTSNSFFVSPYLSLYNSAVVKLIASNGDDGLCVNTAFNDFNGTLASSTAGTITAADLVPGMVAWQSHSHPTNTLSVSITETPFVEKPLSSAEFNHVVSTCHNLLAAGSGRGQCVCPPTGQSGNGLVTPTL